MASGLLSTRWFHQLDIAISVEKYLNMLQAGHNELRAHGKAVAAYRFFCNLHFVLKSAKEFRPNAINQSCIGNIVLL